jgi:hypothetical protein
VMALDPETPHERRFGSDDDETRLLPAANPHLRDILVAMLDTCLPARGDPIVAGGAAWTWTAGSA